MAIAVALGEVSSGPVPLTANVEEIVTFAGSVDVVEILTLSAAAPVYFSTRGATATVGGKQCYVAPSGVGAVQVPLAGHEEGASIRLISAGAASVVVSRT